MTSIRDRVYVGGTFDLFHPGHARLLRRASALGDVWVGLNTDEFAERYKRLPILSYRERRELVLACRYVHQVVPNTGGEDSKPAILGVRPRFIVHGDDWTGPEYMKQLGVTAEWLAEREIELVYLPYTNGISSTEIERRVKERDIHGCRDCSCGKPLEDPRQPSLPDKEAGRDSCLHLGCGCSCAR